MSGELLVRLNANPKVAELLDKLPSKMLSIASDRKAEVVSLNTTGLLETRVDQVSQLISSATFTGKGDKETVPRLYKEYVERIARALTRLVSALSDSSTRLVMAPPMPVVDVPQAPPLRLAAGRAPSSKESFG